ncbi:MAG: fumarylacetoacetate hydrolase family protein [Acidimicrobiales bacterium]
MKLATLRMGARTTAARIEEVDGEAVEVSAADVGALLAQADWPQIAAAAAGTRHGLGEVDYAPLVPKPGKIVCVGQNYRARSAAQNATTPAHPTVFAKFASALAGARDEIVLPPVSHAVDWEVELAVVVGRPARRASQEEAMGAVAGYAVINDVSMRDWQFRTGQFLQGKSFDKATPLGPWLVTCDDPSVDEGGMQLYCAVDGEVVQDANTSDLIFDVAAIVSYLSHAMTLLPGDVIATGTPEGSGHFREPKRYLRDGDVLVSRIAGLGECRNVCRREDG